MFSSLLLLVILSVGCTANSPWRTEPVLECPTPGCGRAVIERHSSYDLAYVEFTERGNVFDRSNLQRVLSHVENLAQADDGVTIIVFVHGWKHNASNTDTNVQSFRRLLDQTAGVLAGTIALDPAAARRKLIGIYIGWRGKSLDLGALNNLSYWERKKVAEQVGKGGATELLLRLERRVVDPQAPNKNLYLVAGHSFGGAIVLSALNEVLLERLVSAEERPLIECQDKGFIRPCDSCWRTRPFGHGVVLLNPAIEANEALQLKEMAAARCFAPNQVRLLHVISSDADQATHKAFRFGQFLGVNLRWRQAELERQFGDTTLRLQESQLDTITVGNFVPFQTGQLNRADDASSRRWKYRSCVGKPDCKELKGDAPHIPVRVFEPLAFIHTDAEFIADHNDIFKPEVAAYLATIIAEARHRRVADSRGKVDPGFASDCLWPDGGFNFGDCFDAFQQGFESQASEAKK